MKKTISVETEELCKNRDQHIILGLWPVDIIISDTNNSCIPVYLKCFTEMANKSIMILMEDTSQIQSMKIKITFKLAIKQVLLGSVQPFA